MLVHKLMLEIRDCCDYCDCQRLVCELLLERRKAEPHAGAIESHFPMDSVHDELLEDDFQMGIFHGRVLVHHEGQ